MNETVIFIIFGIMVVCIVGIIINFMIKSAESDRQYEEAIRKIYNGDYK